MRQHWRAVLTAMTHMTEPTGGVCDYCTRKAIFAGRGWPPGGWMPVWLARTLATKHRACGLDEHLIAAAGAVTRARNR